MSLAFSRSFKKIDTIMVWGCIIGDQKGHLGKEVGKKWGKKWGKITSQNCVNFVLRPHLRPFYGKGLRLFPTRRNCCTFELRIRTSIFRMPVYSRILFCALLGLQTQILSRSFGAVKQRIALEKPALLAAIHEE
jgi:hypothetical protein